MYLSQWQNVFVNRLQQVAALSPVLPSTGGQGHSQLSRAQWPHSSVLIFKKSPSRNPRKGGYFINYRREASSATISSHSFTLDFSQFFLQFVHLNIVPWVCHQKLLENYLTLFNCPISWRVIKQPYGRASMTKRHFSLGHVFQLPFFKCCLPFGVLNSHRWSQIKGRHCTKWVV